MAADQVGHAEDEPSPSKNGHKYKFIASFLQSVASSDELVSYRTLDRHFALVAPQPADYSVDSD